MSIFIDKIFLEAAQAKKKKRYSHPVLFEQEVTVQASPNYIQRKAKKSEEIRGSHQIRSGQVIGV